MGLDHYDSIGLECYIGSMGLDHHDSIGLECYIGPMGLGQRDSIGLEYERDVQTYVDFIGLKLRRVGLYDHQ